MKRDKVGLTILLVATFLAVWAVASPAAQVQQQIALKGGWNAVFLEVEPADAEDPAAVLGVIPDLLSVWAWNPRTSPVEFTTDPTLVDPAAPYMLAWYPGTVHPPIDLMAIYGGQGYLIRRSNGAPDYLWTVSGEPSLAPIRWKPDAFNFVGFPLVAGSEPLFQAFFAGSPAHAGQEIYALDNATSSWVKIASPSAAMKRGEAFWVYCKGGSNFPGTLGVQLSNSDGLLFGSQLTESPVGLFNRSTDSASVTVSIDSAAPHLKYMVFDPEATPKMSWPDLFSQPPSPYVIPAGGRADINLGALRAGIPAGATRTANLTISNGSMRRLVPVSVTGVSYAGLWVGDAVVRKVSQPGLPEQDGPDVPRPTGSEFSLRLIVHLDSGGQARLLREVMQLWNEGSGHYVLLANESRLNEFAPGTMRGGEMVGRRISSASFGFPGYRDLSGAFTPGGTLSGQVFIPWDDPVNPFRHKYHPDHKTWEQSYQVTRDISLEFTEQIEAGPPAGAQSVLGWGTKDVGGIYREVLSLKRPDDPYPPPPPDAPATPDDPYVIHVEGTFLLHKVCDIGALEY